MTIPRHILLNDLNGYGHVNINPQTLQRWRAAKSRVRNGSARAKLLFIGDSTTMGSGSGSGGSFSMNGAFAKAWPRQLISQLNNLLPVQDGTFYGDQNTSVSYPLYDPRVAEGVGWAPFVSNLGGNMFRFTAGTAGLLSFTPTFAIDNFKIYYLQQAAGNGAFTTNIDGGASLGTTNTLGAAGVLSTTFTVARAAHTINITPDNLGTLFIIGITAWDSTIPAIDAIQLGFNGAKTADFTNTGAVWSPMTVLPTLVPDLTVVMLTVNDSNNNTALATYQSQTQTIITTAKSTGDVLLAVGPPSNTTQATDGTLDKYIAILQNLAILNNCGLLNLKTRWTSFAVTNPNMPYFDTVHPGAVGYRDIGQAVFECI